ncbi:MAG: ComEC family competence protein [bacterium ADurb.Bin400]|nr:MAG: ComEC family competence protein [bacterium ADurb.Bin400]
MQKATRIILTLLLFLLFFVWSEVIRGSNPDGYSLYFFDVGQGDAALIQRGSYQILIDGGPDDSVLTALGRVMPPSDRHIEMVILTHPHADHYNGLIHVASRYKIDRIFMNDMGDESPTYSEFIRRIISQNIAISVPDPSNVLFLPLGATLEFLWPYEAEGAANLNNISIVNRFCYVEKCALLLGDLENDSQQALLASKPNKIRAEIIKIAHHGSRNASNSALLQQVAPLYAVISVGADNRYKHPHPEALAIIEETRSVMWRTDQNGSVEFWISRGQLELIRH